MERKIQIFITLSLFFIIMISCGNQQRKQETNDINSSDSIGVSSVKDFAENEAELLENDKIDCDATPDCTVLTEEEKYAAESIEMPVDRGEGIYKNNNLSDNDFLQTLNNMEITKLPITLVSEKVCFRDICKEPNKSGLEDFYWFNIQELEEYSTSCIGENILSKDEIIKAFSSYRLPNKGDLRLILYETVSYLYPTTDEVYSLWILCSMLDNKIVDIDIISSTSRGENDIEFYNSAEIDINYNVLIKGYSNRNPSYVYECKIRIDESGNFIREED